MISIPFSKYSGCGNDFVLVDNRSSFFPVHEISYIRHLCDRREGIGTDGVILLESLPKPISGCASSMPMAAKRKCVAMASDVL